MDGRNFSTVPRFISMSEFTFYKERINNELLATIIAVCKEITSQNYNSF